MTQTTCKNNESPQKRGPGKADHNAKPIKRKPCNLLFVFLPSGLVFNGIGIFSWTPEKKKKKKTKKKKNRLDLC